MADLFSIAVQRLVELGFYNFILPFILFTTLFYAVMRRTQVLGDSVLINGLLSTIVGLFVFGTPVILGISLVVPLTAFLTQAAVAMLVFLIGFLIASFFYPNIMEKLPEIFKTPGPATWLIWIVAGIGVAFGMYSIAQGAIDQTIARLGASKDLVFLTAVVIVTFMIFMLVAYSKPGES